MNLYQIDLNLLILFDALYRNRSVARAADEMCLSQSAFSHGLSRLRKRLADDLFIRINNVMEPTPLAHELAVNITPALQTIHNSLNHKVNFEPATSNIEFTLAATDFTQLSLLPKLIAHINKVAPNIKITVVHSEDKTPTTKLMNGELDFILGFSHEIESSSTVAHQTWLIDDYCTVARRNHPAIKNKLTLDNFLNLSHILISPWGEDQGIVDLELAKKGLKRHISLQLPNVITAPYAVAESNLLLTLPKRVALPLSKQVNINVYAPPIAIPEYRLNIYWHKLNTNKPSHQWLINLIKNINYS